MAGKEGESVPKYDVRFVLTQEGFQQVRGLVDRLAGPVSACCPTSGGCVEILVDDVRNGELPDLEDALVERAVAFDRYTACEPPVVRRFRPGQEGAASADAELELTSGEAAVPVSQLVRALEKYPGGGDLRREIERLVSRAGPVPLDMSPA